MEIQSRRVLLSTLLSAITAGKLRAISSRVPAPRFSATTLDGEKFTNDSVKGKVVLLQFWTTWCPYCRADEHAVDAVAKDFADAGLIVLAVNVGESKKKVKKYLEDSPRACKIVLTSDTNLAAMYAATAYPIYVLIDKEGKIAETKRGGLGEDRLRRLLRSAGLGDDPA